MIELKSSHNLLLPSFFHPTLCTDPSIRWSRRLFSREIYLLFMPVCFMIPKIPNRVAAISINITVDYRFGIFSHVHSDGFWLTDTSCKGDLRTRVL